VAKPQVALLLAVLQQEVMRRVVKHLRTRMKKQMMRTEYHRNRGM
jgi:predicted small metal-binding protein